ncbi:hypothetical protein BD410DRAFT_797025, partial [Rickenella mellea]
MTRVGVRHSKRPLPKVSFCNLGNRYPFEYNHRKVIDLQMSETKVCMGITPNPDVSGLGIRLGLYITCFLLAVIPREPRTQDLISSLLSNTRVFTFSLLLTAIIQTGQGQLTLYHATLIFQMLIFFSMGILPTPYEFIEKGSLRLAMFTASSFLAFFAWSLYVWSTALTFGSQPECNHSTKYVYFWVTVRATATWMRKWWTALNAIAFAYVVIITIIGLAFGYTRSSLSGHTGSVSNENADGDDNDEAESDDKTLAWLGVFFRLT